MEQHSQTWTIFSSLAQYSEILLSSLNLAPGGNTFLTISDTTSTEVLRLRKGHTLSGRLHDPPCSAEAQEPRHHHLEIHEPRRPPAHRPSAPLTP